MLNGSAVVRRTKLAEHVYRVAAEREEAEKRSAAQKAARGQAARLKASVEAAARAYREEQRKSPYAPVVANPSPTEVKRREPRARLSTIIDCACRYFGLSHAELVSRSRCAGVVQARHVAVFVAYEAGVATLPQIGKALGRDHTTVLNSVRKVREMTGKGSRSWVDAVSALRSMSFSVSVEEQPYWGC
jgi:chromosomal replication initiation ATPase DnaA